MGTFTAEILDNKEAVAARAAEIIAESVRDSTGTFSVALAGGTTPRLLYSMLAAQPFVEMIPWKQMRWFFGDERFVPADHADSNYRMVKESLFEPATIPAETVFRVKTELGEPKQVAEDYEQQIVQTLAPADGAVPVFDLILLGMGADGHTASLFPHTSALAEDEKFVAPNFVPAMDTWRITLTAQVLLAAKHVVMLVTGEEKAEALAQVLEGDENINTYPSQLLRGRHDDTLFLIDEAAAKDLGE
jgi:6-phosphogluconolactonase